MARFARIFVIALVSAAGSCSSEQLSQKEVKRKEDIREQLATAYDSCVRTSFASQLPTMVDRNMAMLVPSPAEVWATCSVACLVAPLPEAC